MRDERVVPAGHLASGLNQPDQAKGDGTSTLGAGELIAPGYEYLAQLSRGTVFDVFDVWSEQRACRCVAKTLTPECLNDDHQRERLLNEGRLLERLSHPHIVRCYESIERPLPVLILETLPGATLGAILRQRSWLSAADLALLGLHLASALHYLHRQSFLHLDLKPANIICHGGMAKLIDLSIAQSPGTGRGAGTPNYMAPEQVRCELLSEATDVWGLGLVLYEAASGRRPFQSDDSRYEQLKRRAEPVRGRRRLPAALTSAIDRCLEPEPAERPSVDDLLKLAAALV